MTVLLSAQWCLYSVLRIDMVVESRATAGATLIVTKAWCSLTTEIAASQCRRPYMGVKIQ